jgi:hypothetical protein
MHPAPRNRTTRQALRTFAGGTLVLFVFGCVRSQGWGAAGYRPPAGGTWADPEPARQPAPQAPPAPPAPPAATDSRCPVCGPAVAMAALQDDEIAETSGIVASSRSGDVFYVHNDSGDGARFFGVDRKGATRATFRVAGVFALDWEDVARGPCGAGSCLFLGDIGDNLKFRGSVTLVRVSEPDPTVAGERDVTSERMNIAYPDGAHDAEALLVHPKTGAITIVTKAWSGAAVYELPGGFAPGAPATFEKRGGLALPKGAGVVTAGDVHPGGRGVLLRTARVVLYYPMTAGMSVAEALSGTACDLPAVADAQAEAIGFRSGGEGYVMVSEGEHATLHGVSCPGM